MDIATSTPVTIQLSCRFRHPNLVTLIGYSSSPGKDKCLIYEFLPNGTLEEALEIGVRRWMGTTCYKRNQKTLQSILWWIVAVVAWKGYDNNACTSQLGGGATLNTKSGSIRLPWMCRLSIACDTARGLAYLHTADRNHPLVHRDVKRCAGLCTFLLFHGHVSSCSANVLLDLSFRAKVGDFGLARGLREEEEEARTARVVGTSGYIPPEYYRGVITTKMDTFGFGVVSA